MAKGYHILPLNLDDFNVTNTSFCFSVQSGVLLMEPPIVVDDFEENNSSFSKHNASRSLSVSVQPAIVVRRRTTYANGRAGGDGVQGRIGGGGSGGVQRSMSLSLRRPMSMSCINTSSSGLRRIMPGNPSSCCFQNIVKLIITNEFPTMNIHNKNQPDNNKQILYLAKRYRCLLPLSFSVASNVFFTCEFDELCF